MISIEQRTLAKVRLQNKKFLKLFHSGQRQTVEKPYVVHIRPFRMTNKPKSESSEVWVNPRSNFFRAGHQAWDRRSSDISNTRYLDLADIALRPRPFDSTPLHHSQDAVESTVSQPIEKKPATNHE
jgi:hypothetical protein